LKTTTKVVESSEHWDIIITPKAGLFDLKLKELWHYRDLLKLWVRRQFVGTYKQTLMGPLWHFISPIFGTLSYMFIFGKVANLSTGGVPMFLFYSAGIAIWNFFMGCFSSSSSAFSANAGIFGKVYFPRLIMPLASIVSSVIKFGIQIALFLVFYFYFIIAKDYHPNVGWALLYIPISLVVLGATGFGLGILVSSVTTKYRDVGIMVGFVMTVVMYVTPVIYSYPTLSPQLKYWVSFNPLVAPIEMFRYAWFGIGEFSLGTFLYSVTWMIVMLFTGIVLFNKVEKNFMDTV
jgi:lipopolysaccharide transport system permease protein